MKLATLRDGSRDGRLLVVRRDGLTGLPSPDAWPTLQRALDDWEAAEPALRALAEKLDLPASRLTEIIDGDCPVDAEIDLRLGRYFGMSEGFFLRLQNGYDLLEAKRALWSAIMRVEPRIVHAA